MSSRRREALELFYHRMRARFSARLHQFVRLEEEEAARMRRRLHIHLCLLCLSSSLTFLSVADYISITVLTSASTGVLAVQEFIDCIGQF